MRPVAPPPPIVADWPPDPDETPDAGRDDPEPDPPELVPDPLRDDADPDLVADDDGVRDPLGVWILGGSAPREGADEVPELVDPPEEPEEPEDPDEPEPLLVRGIACSLPEPVGPAGAPDEPDSAAVRGIACAIAAAGAANAIARATTIKRGFLSMCVVLLQPKNPTGRLLLKTLQQYCHQPAAEIP